MRYFLAALTPLFIMLMSVLTLAATHPVANGVIALDGFPYGVILCGEGEFIDPAYDATPEAAQLRALAAEMCPTF
jgi:hypothetical protein